MKLNICKYKRGLSSCGSGRSEVLTYAGSFFLLVTSRIFIKNDSKYDRLQKPTNIRIQTRKKKKEEKKRRTKARLIG